MITTLLFDFSRVLLFTKDRNYKGDLNPLNKQLLSENPNYDYLSYFDPNQELLNYLDLIKDKFELYIFTSGSVQNNSAIKPTLERIFRSVISAEEIGVSKKDVSGYQKVLEIINKEPSEVLFVDDSETNIKVASQAGLLTFKFEANNELIKYINSL